MPYGARIPLLLSALGMTLMLASFQSQSQSQSRQRQFTIRDVAEIKAALRELDPHDYRIVLPKFRNGTIIGSETVGLLPITKVRRIASQNNLHAFKPTGNVQAIFEPDNASGKGGGQTDTSGDKSGTTGDQGGGPGSHINSGSAAKGLEIGDKIQSVLDNIDQSQYVLLR